MKNLKKILIITYFFPPSTFTGSFRIYSWAKFLAQYGYYPVIVTRNWDVPITEYKDMAVSTTDKVVHIKYDNYEVYYLPYKGNFRDRLFNKYGDDKMVFPRKILTSFELIFQNFTSWVVPFRNLLKFSDSLLLKQQDIMCVIASGKPFVLFRFCHILAKKYRIPWIADYRDDWNTSQWLNSSVSQGTPNIPFKERMLTNIEKKSEKKWLSNASCFISISQNYVDRISAFINKPGFRVMNGFDPDDYDGLNRKPEGKTFTVLFNGTLYDTQPVEIFTDAFKKMISAIKPETPVKIVFLGLEFEKKQAERIRALLCGCETYYEITDRMDKREALSIMSCADVFLMFAHKNIKGVTSSKIFDYLALEKPVLLCPTDNEVLEKIVLSTNSGFVCNTTDEIYNTLINLYNEFHQNGVIIHKPDKEKIIYYSRKNQSLRFADIINKIFDGEIINAELTEEHSQGRKLAFNIINKSFSRSFLRFINGCRSTVRILCFHNISDKRDLSYPSLKPELFYNLIRYINSEYDIISISGLHNIPLSVKRPVILTFDDGYKNFSEFALPVLKEFNAPAINNIIVECTDNNVPFWTQRLNYALSYIYRYYRKINYRWNDIILTNYNLVSSPEYSSLQIFKKLLLFDRVDREDFLSDLENKFGIEYPENWGLMNWEEIKYCVKSGVEIGSHTMTHDSLITINNQEILMYEIEQSKKILENKLGISIDTLALPNGLYNKSITAVAEKSGYKYLLSTEEKHYKKNISDPPGTLILPRISINTNDNNENFLKVENFHNLIKLKMGR